ncbi:MAG: hypothetical protein MSR29_00850 [Lachnospiraceae bacterium]|nr:hypothetical protein [Lachnospiraceae bacterium]
MPKLKSTETEVKNRIAYGYISQKQIIYDVSDARMAKALDINLRVYQRKKREPDSFRLSQWRTIARILHFDDEEKAKII